MLYVVGFGSGSRQGMTSEAVNAVESSDVIFGYTTYVNIMKEYFPDKEYRSTPMMKERERVREALKAAENQTVSLICSGDSSVYAMAGLVYEMSCEFPNAQIEIVPGVTAALSGSALLGSPLTHDFAVISLSDLMTSWEKIALRLECAAKGDFVIVLYNPSSKKRTEHLKKACEIIMRYKSPETICGIAKNIGRTGEESMALTLKELADYKADMFTTVFIGNSETKLINGKMVTPRGYKDV